MYYFRFKINTKKGRKKTGVSGRASPRCSFCSPSRGPSPLSCGRLEVPPRPRGCGGPAGPGTGTPAEPRVCLGLAEPNQGRLPAVFRQGCERRLLSPFYT